MTNEQIAKATKVALQNRLDEIDDKFNHARKTRGPLVVHFPYYQNLADEYGRIENEMNRREDIGDDEQPVRYFA